MLAQYIINIINKHIFNEESLIIFLMCQLFYHHRRLQHLSFRCIFVNWKGIFIFWCFMTIKARITLIWNSSTQKSSRLFTHYAENILYGSYSATTITTITTTTSFIMAGLEKALWANSFLVFTLLYRKITRLGPSSWRPSCGECCLSQSSRQKSSTTAGWSESMATKTVVTPTKATTRILLSEMVGAVRYMIMFVQFL